MFVRSSSVLFSLSRKYIFRKRKRERGNTALHFSIKRTSSTNIVSRVSYIRIIIITSYSVKKTKIWNDTGAPSDAASSTGAICFNAN